MPGRPRKKRIRSKGEGGSSTRVSKVVGDKEKWLIGQDGNLQLQVDMDWRRIFFMGPLCEVDLCKAWPCDYSVNDTNGVQIEALMDAAQNINNSTLRSILPSERLIGSNFTKWHRKIVLRYKKKLSFVEQPMAPAPNPETADQEIIDKYYESINGEQEAKQEQFETVKAFHACKQEDGQSVSSYLLKRKSYLDTLFVQNYNMHSMEKTITELHAMLKLHEKGIPKKAETPVVLAIREPKIPPPPKRDNPGKDSICHHYKEGIRRKRKLKHGALNLYLGNGMCVAIKAIGSFDFVRFMKLINDMRNIKMTMPKMQLNSKFVNNMLPEWGRLVTVVKLNKGLKTSNYDQLYAYLKQHEAHANENKIMLERYTQYAIDPLAFVSNVFLQQYPTQSLVIPQSAYVPPINNQLQFADNIHLDSGLTPTDDLIENLTKTVALLRPILQNIFSSN
ncbi:hypothetical protein Tco_0550282 [Tanacetum coccineum]